jgi:ABC-2 type transport system ATP-binding protein
MDHGKLIAAGTHEELVRLAGQETRIDLKVDLHAQRVAEAWKAVQGVSRVSIEDSVLSVLVKDSNAVLPQLFEAARGCSSRVTSVDIHEPNLETVFLLLTGRELRD